MERVKPRIATVTGTMLRPGVSLNKRLYTPGLIASAATRLQTALDNGANVTMLEAHPDPNNPTEKSAREVVGRLSKVWVNEGGDLKYTADIPDTQAGRDIAALAQRAPGAAQPYVNVSIRGEWIGEQRMVPTESGTAITADGLDIKGLDFTRSPGVQGLVIDAVQVFESEPTTQVTEWHEALVEAEKKPYGDVQYADPGYQADKVKRYPLDTAKHVRAAWSYINMDKNAGKYSADQLSAIKGRIKTAAKKLGIDISEAYTPQEVGEILEAITADGFYGHALTPIDPDGDGDVDAWLCPTCGQLTPETRPQLNPDGDDDADESAPTEGTSTATTPSQVKETSMSEPVAAKPAENTPAPASTAPAAVTESADDALAQKIARIVAETLKQNAPTESAPVMLSESAVNEKIAAAVKEARAETVKEVAHEFARVYGAPQRRGLITAYETAPAAKEGEDRKDGSMSDEEFLARRRELTNGLFATPEAS